MVDILSISNFGQRWGLETRDIKNVKIGTLEKFARGIGQPLYFQIGEEKIRLS